MSRIVALLHRDRRPVEQEMLSRLVAPLRNRGSDGPRFWLGGAAGLAYQCLRASIGSGEAQPGVLGASLSICFDGRLDNREELIRALGPDVRGDPLLLPDAFLVTACYRRFGESFATNLNGDYALALFDREKQQLVLSRDVMGVRPLYYWLSGDTFIAASEVKAILAHPRVDAQPDDNALADLLVGGNPNELRLTLFRDVRRVVPGHTVIVTAERFREFQHWDFDPTRQVRCGSLAEYAEGARVLFEQAVRRRLRASGAVAVAVSGGLDSSAILCQAELLGKVGESRQPVHGISRLYPEGSPADERTYLADIETQYGVDIRRIPSSPVRVVDDDQWLWRVEYPAYQGNAYLECLEVARELSCSTLLHGYYGDQILWSPAHLFDLMRGFRWMAAHREIQCLAASMTDGSPRELRDEMLRRFLRDLVPDWLMRPHRAIRRLTARDRTPRWFAATLRDRAHARSQQQRRYVGRFASRQAEHCYRLAHGAHVTMVMEASNKVASCHGLEKAYPFADRDLIAYFMAIPGEIVTCGAKYKGLFREAMRGILPESIRLRYWKADYTLVESDAASALGSSGLEANLCAGSLAVARGYIDAAALPASLLRHKAALTGQNYLPAKQMNELLAFENWLRAFFAGGHSVNRTVGL